MNLIWTDSSNFPPCARAVEANDGLMRFSAEIPADMTLEQAAAEYFRTADYSEGLDYDIDFVLLLDAEPEQYLCVSPAEATAMRNAHLA